MVYRSGLIGLATGVALLVSACSGEDEAPHGDTGSQAAAPAAPNAQTATKAAAGEPVMVAGLTGDPAKGEKVFLQCKTCHALEPGENRIGPTLHQVVGRPAGKVPEFRYSEVNKASGLVWTEDALFTYLENPRKVMPGTYMSYAGLKNPQLRADLIAYLKNDT